MILIHPLKLAYENIPKLATTSIFEWLYQVLHGKPFDEAAEGAEIHRWFLAQNTSLIQATKRRAPPPAGYFTFCVIRDPVKRLISAYRNRVGSYGELGPNRQGMAELLAQGLRADPEINYFISHLGAYRELGSIRHHTRPMSAFTGNDLSRYDAIYDIGALKQLRDRLAERAISFGVAKPARLPPEMPQSQMGGPAIGLEALTEESLKTLLRQYKADYDLFPGLDTSAIRAEWEAARSGRRNGTAGPDAISFIPRDVAAIAKASILGKPSAAADGSGNMRAFSGLVVVKKGKAEQGRLLFRDADGTGVLPWLPSPRMASRLPGNPHAAQARFIAKGLRVSGGSPVSILWESPSPREVFVLFSTERDGAQPQPGQPAEAM